MLGKQYVASPERPSTYAYYPLFWYSSYHNTILKDVHHSHGRNWRSLTQQHFHLLCLLFDHTYIPRTHITNHYTDYLYDHMAYILDSKLGRGLAERGILVTSNERGMDAYTSNSVIIDLISNIDWLSRNRLPDVLKSAAHLPAIYVDNEVEALNNISSFQHLFKAHSNEAFRTRYEELTERSLHPEIGFFHEDFLRRARSTFNDAEFEAVWRATNSLYLTTGAPNVHVIYPLFFGLIEHPREIVHDGHLRPLYSPVGLSHVITTLSSLQTLLSLLSAETGVFLSMLDRDEFAVAKERFSTKYFDMCRELCRFIDVIGIDITSRNGWLQELVITYLSGRVDSYLGDLLSSASVGVGSAVNMIDPISGLAANTALGGAKKLALDYASRFLLRRRHPEMIGMVDIVEKTFRV